MAKRTTLRSSKGKKLYAVRDKEGKFKDIQTYKRAHTLDMKRKSKAEVAAKAKTKTKKAKTKVKRSEFGMQWNAALEAGGVLVGDEVTIQIEVSLVRSK